MNIVVFVGAMAVALLLLILIQENHRKKQAALRNLEQIREEYGKRPFSLPVRSRQVKIEKSMSEDAMWIDDLTWNDLDMDSVFKRLDYTRSSAGHEMLYHMLRKPLVQVEELEKREALITLFQQEEKQREKLSELLSAIGTTGKYTLQDYLDQIQKAKPGRIRKHLFLDLLYIPVLVLLFIHPLWGLCSLFVLAFACILDYFQEKAKVNPYLVSFAYILRMLHYGKQIGKAELPSLGVYQDVLKKAEKKLTGLEAFSGFAMSMDNPVGSSDPVSVLFEYVNMLFHFNLMKIASMFRVVKKEKDTVMEMVHVIGYLDACISIAYYRASLEEYCVPAWNREALEAESVYHPLLENPVKNNLKMEKNILLTGSNASGKSTFLKTMGIQVIFSQTICTCNAKHISLPVMKVMSSMAVRDSLQSGDSYYVAEIKAMKRIMDACESGRRPQCKEENMSGSEQGSKQGSKQGSVSVFCLVDEVLRGTNTVERIAASCEILKSLSKPGVLCMAATHDIELTDLLAGYFDNYHFQETIENGDVKFSYELQRGKASSRNAIKLLQVMGYDAKVVQDAEKMATDFLSTGKWM